MPRRVLLGVVAAGLVALAVVAVLQRTKLAFTLGVPRQLPAVALQSGHTGCQQPIDVPAHAAFDQVAVPVGTYHAVGSPLRLDVLDPQRRVLARGRLAGGYPDIGLRTVERIPLDRTVRAPAIAVCVRNLGPRPVALYGSVGLAAHDSQAVQDGRPLATDIAFVFERSPRSLAGLAGTIADRAALFRYAWLRGWVYFLLAAALVGVGTWLLTVALRAAVSEGR
jgi:hypothetical protein